METINVARELINSNDSLASVDLSDAYFSIPIHESYRTFLRFIWKEQLSEFVCLPFGYSLAPRTFTKVPKPLYALLRSNGMKVCYYIDDTLIFVASKAECSANVHKVIRLLGDFGFKTNYKKSQFDPVTRLTYLGFILDSSTMASPSLDHLTRKLWVWCPERDIFVVAQHVPGKDNVYADYHSRNFNEKIEWSLHPTVFRWITQRLWYPEIDLFASRLNAKVKKFVSWRPNLVPRVFVPLDQRVGLRETLG